MIRNTLAAASCAAALLLAAPAGAEPPLSAAETKAVEAIIARYMVENPEVLVRAFEALERQQIAAQEAETSAALAEIGDQLRQAPTSPVVGNPDGDVTLVEFFDYRCGYCKQVAPSLAELIHQDGDLRVVMKELPILSPESMVAAQAALAANMQGRYWDFHMALMRARGQLTERRIMQIAEELGLDTERLARDMESDAVTAELEANRQLASQLGITGTPAFVIGDQVVPGAIDKAQMADIIAQEREG